MRRAITRLAKQATFPVPMPEADHGSEFLYSLLLQNDPVPVDVALVVGDVNALYRHAMRPLHAMMRLVVLQRAGEG